jgi:rRNA-processing protein FCF1
MFAVVDTNFLLGLAWNDEDTIDAVQTLELRAPHLLISATQTVLEELRFFKEQATNKGLKAAATKALASFKTIWGFNAVLLSSGQQNRVEKIANHLRQAQVLPREERHDSFILVEAAFIEAKLLVTEDSMLRGADYARLVFELGGFGLHAPVLATPKEIVSKFFH